MATAQEVLVAKASPGVTAEEMGYLEQLQRLQAEFSNYRRRIQKERAEWQTRAKGELLTGLLPILDDLARARASIESEPDGKDAEGLLMIVARLETCLESAGLEAQKTEPGMPFDPNYHEALMTGVSGTVPEGMILQTLQPGYVYRDLLLRPARVQVSRGPEAQISDSGEAHVSEETKPQVAASTASQNPGSTDPGEAT